MIPMYNLMKYTDSYAKTLGSLWQYCGDELDNTDNKTNSDSFLHK